MEGRPNFRNTYAREKRLHNGMGSNEEINSLVYEVLSILNVLILSYSKMLLRQG